METYCAWCGIRLRTTPLEGSPPGRDSHGICPDCASALLEDQGTPVAEFLRSLRVPVLLVSEDVEVLDANQVALGLLGKTADAVRGRLGGEVFECAHAELPGGCGRTIHCSGCVLRRTVTETYEEGVPHVRVPATLKTRDEHGPSDADLLITTALVGGRVLVRFEPAS